MKETYLQTLSSVKMKFLEKIPIFIISLFVAFLLIKIYTLFLFHIKKVILRNTKKLDETKLKEFEKRLDTILDVIKTIGEVSIWIIFITLVLKNMGVDIKPIIAGAGIIGLAFGFGSQELVKDVISGIFILVENQIRIGDVAIINGTGGLVERIGLRTIILREQSGTVHIFQNGKINTLSNMTKDWSALVLEIRVSYNENIDKVMKIMKKVGDDLQKDKIFKEKIIESIEVMGLEKFENSAMIIKARIKTRPIQQWETAREYRKRLKEEFDKENIQMPYPHRTIYWGNEIKPLQVEKREVENDFIK